MTKHTNAKHADLGSLTEDARALMTATADVAEGKVAEARQRLTAALDSGKEIYALVKDKAVEGMNDTDKAVHKHPYKAIGIGIGVGALVGFLAAHRFSRNGN